MRDKPTLIVYVHVHWKVHEEDELLINEMLKRVLHVNICIFIFIALQIVT